MTTRTARVRLLLTSSALIGVALTGTACSSSSATPPAGQHSRTSGPATTPNALVAAASWTHPSEGYRLHVTPSTAGRNHAAARPARALAQALRKAGPAPLRLDAQVRGSLLNQLKCHAVFASHKARWNLEAWRPDVGYVATVTALCNPNP